MTDDKTSRIAGWSSTRITRVSSRAPSELEPAELESAELGLAELELAELGSAEPDDERSVGAASGW
jgi:hypothetical protein